MNTTPMAILVFGAQTPFGGALRVFFRIGGLLESANARRQWGCRSGCVLEDSLCRERRRKQGPKGADIMKERTASLFQGE